MSESAPKWIVDVFGKEGCAKCTMLNRRLDKMLAEERFAAFRKRYHDILTEDGLVRFCLAQCLNPSRIPAMLLSRLDSAGQSELLPNPDPDGQDELCGKAKLYQYLGLQTDYSGKGGGIISPEMIESILLQAQQSGE